MPGTLLGLRMGYSFWGSNVLISQCSSPISAAPSKGFSPRRRPSASSEQATTRRGNYLRRMDADQRGVYIVQRMPCGGMGDGNILGVPSLALLMNNFDAACSAPYAVCGKGINWYPNLAALRLRLLSR